MNCLTTVKGTLRCALCLALPTVFFIGAFARAETVPAWKDPQPKEQYQSALQRLHTQYSLENVALSRTEVGWDDVQGLATHLSFRVPVQSCHHPDLVFVHPDMSISLGLDQNALGVGFAIGSPAVLPNMWKVVRKLSKGYLPIVESEWKAGDLTVSQTAFGILPKDDEVRTGKETQYVVVRMSITNTGDMVKESPLFLIVGKMGGSQVACYEPYLAPVSRWQTAPLGMEMRESALVQNGRILLVYRSDKPTPATFHTMVDNKGAAGDPNKLTNCVRFDLQLKPKQTRTIDIVVAGTPQMYPVEEQAAMERVAFDTALKRASTQWEREFEPGMRLVTPDSRINDIYKAMILSNLGMLIQYPDKPWQVPVQTSPLNGTWSWEFAHAATPMMSIGYHKEFEPSLRYFTERQNGVGAHDANVGPSGAVKSTKGSYVGTVMFWMSETGSILWTLAEKYRYSHDINWLKANKASILAACDWVQGARNITRIVDANGNKAPSFGLLPLGSSNDSGRNMYSFTMTDNFTWLGMSEMAKAFQEAGLPEAERLKSNADEYRQCILDTVQKEETVDPETRMRFIPEFVGGKAGDPVWPVCGPVQLFGTGFFAPTNTYFVDMVDHTKWKHGILMGMPGRFAGGMAIGSSEWYTTVAEMVYYKCYLARGEFEKAMLVLYCTLVYDMSSDTYQTAERFHFDDRNYSPLQPNASNDGRNIEMMRRMVIDEQDADDGKLWLLRGCPRRWFANGESIVVENAPTLFGKMAVKTKSEGKRITVDIDCPDRDIPKEIRVAVRHPERKPMLKATVDGKPVAIEGESVILKSPKGSVRVKCEY